ncbi:MAG: CPBP family intramembrane metalloprotease [Gammaproteobacteria bacterium]|nr:CPBP family intramembrane metalloprotease [Gammaproteobacteria bacterium]
MKVAFLRRHPLLSFYLLAYGFTWSLGVPQLLSRRGLIDVHVPHLVEPVAAFGPFFAALVVLYSLNGHAGLRTLRQDLLRWRIGPGWLVLSLLSTPLLLLLAVFGARSLSGAELTLPSRLVELASISGLFDLIVVGGLLQSLGEEPGWRGFAVPTLRERFGPLLATLALWPVWLCWHLPFFLSRPEFGWPQWIGFSIGILSAAIWLTLLRDGTQSILACVGWHALANICRNTALAVSSAAFLVYNNLILFSALLIAGYWIWSARRASASGG